jgi:hypothetical protein
VLQQREAVVELLVYRFRGQQTDDAAHGRDSGTPGTKLQSQLPIEHLKLLRLWAEAIS